MAELDRRAEAARQRMARASVPLEPPASLAEARKKADKARKAALDAERREDEAKAKLAAAEASRPRGVLAWVTGKAAAAERQIQTLEKDLRAATEDVRIRRVVRGGADQKEDREARAHAEAEAEHRRRQDGLQRLGRMDLARVDRLRRALEAQPGWAAHGVDALSQHIDRADAVRRAEEAQRREEERRRQEAEDRTHRPRGPTR